MTGNNNHNPQNPALMKELRQQQVFLAEAVGHLLELLADPDAGLSTADLRKRVTLLLDGMVQGADHKNLLNTLQDLAILLRQDRSQGLIERERQAGYAWVDALQQMLEQTPRVARLQQQVDQAADRAQMLQVLEAIAAMIPEALAATRNGRQSGVSLHLEQVRQTLIRLLDSLLRTAAIGPQAARVRERLLTYQDNEPLLLAQAGEESASLALQALQLERRAFAEYLNRFRKSLQKGQDSADRCRADHEELERHLASWNSQFSLWHGETEQQLESTNDVETLKQLLRAAVARISQLQKQSQVLINNSMLARTESLESLERHLRHIQADAAQHKQQAEHFSELSRRDALTHLPNRLAYEERVEHELQSWRRSGRPLSLAILDLDHFKHINDRFGHLVGDRVLQAVASRIRSSLREVDFVARIGGEEFMVILPDTSMSAAYRVLERLREQLAAMPFRFRGEVFFVQISIGLGLAGAGDTLDRLYGRSDDALALAKQQGRNRILTQDDVSRFDAGQVSDNCTLIKGTDKEACA